MCSLSLNCMCHIYQHMWHQIPTAINANAQKGEMKTTEAGAISAECDATDMLEQLPKEQSCLSSC